jgi:hypothetical protein
LISLSFWRERSINTQRYSPREFISTARTRIIIKLNLYFLEVSSFGISKTLQHSKGVLLNTVMVLSVPWSFLNFSSRWATGSFSRTAQLRGVGQPHSIDTVSSDWREVRFTSSFQSKFSYAFHIFGLRYPFPLCKAWTERGLYILYILYLIL